MLLGMLARHSHIYPTGCSIYLPTHFILDAGIAFSHVSICVILSLYMILLVMLAMNSYKLATKWKQDHTSYFIGDAENDFSLLLTRRQLFLIYNFIGVLARMLLLVHHMVVFFQQMILLTMLAIHSNTYPPGAFIFPYNDFIRDDDNAFSHFFTC